MIFQRREVFRRLGNSHECNLVFDGRVIITLPLEVRTFGVENMLLDISRILLCVALLAFYVAFYSGNHLC